MLEEGSVRVLLGGRVATAVASDPPTIQGCPSVMFDAWVTAVESEGIDINREAAEAWDRWFEIVFILKKSTPRSLFGVRCAISPCGITRYVVHTLGVPRPIQVNCQTASLLKVHS